MNLCHIAWRNVGRNRRRSFLSALAVAFAVAVLMFSMGLQKGSYTEMIYSAVHAHSGHLQIQKEGYLERMDMAKNLGQVDRLLTLLEGQKGIAAFAPRVNAAALVSKEQRTFGAVLFGIDPEREARTSTLKEVMVDGKYLEPGDGDGVLIGERLAKNLNACIGDEIVFLGQGADGSLAAGRLLVRGIFSFGSGDMDRTTLFAPIAVLQEAYSMQGAVSEVAVLLEDDALRSQVTASLSRLLSRQGFDGAVVVGWPELLPGVEQSIRIDWTSGLIMYAVLALVVGFGIANTFLMAFMERMHECGVLLSIGMRPLRLGLMMYIESVLLSVAGIALGVAVGIPLVSYYQKRGIDFGEGAGELMREYGMSSVIHLELSFEVVTWAVAIVLAVALAVAVYPAIKASRLSPVEALRKA